MKNLSIIFYLSLLAGLALNGCGNSVTVAAGYRLSGTVSGQSGSLTLENNGRDDLVLSSTQTAFTFASALLPTDSYAITVSTPPPGQICTVGHGSGTITTRNVQDITVTCADTPPTYTIGGSVSGLAAGASVTLQNNGGDDVLISANGTFVFSTALTDPSPFAVTVLNQPTNQTCTVTSGNGTLAGADVTGVAVTCVTTSFFVGGTLSGLAAGASITLQNNGGDNALISADGSFAFSTAVPDATPYSVTVLTQPANQTCNVTSGSGTLAGADVTNVAVSCTTTNFRIFLTLASQSGGSLGGPAAADALCEADAAKPSTGTYKALLVAPGVREACTTANCSGGVAEHTDWVFAPSTSYYQTDLSTLILTTDASGIFVFGTYTNPVAATSTGYWSGLNTDWTTSANTCTSWTDPAGLGQVGLENATDATAIYSGVLDVCTDSTIKLLCVEQ